MPNATPCSGNTMASDLWRSVEYDRPVDYVIWGWNHIDGVQIFTRGIGGEWWLMTSQRAWAPPVKWQPLVYPQAPGE